MKNITNEFCIVNSTNFRPINGISKMCFLRKPICDIVFYVMSFLISLLLYVEFSV